VISFLEAFAGNLCMQEFLKDVWGCEMFESEFLAPDRIFSEFFEFSK